MKQEKNTPEREVITQILPMCSACQSNPGGIKSVKGGPGARCAWRWYSLKRCRGVLVDRFGRGMSGEGGGMVDSELENMNSVTMKLM